MPQNLKNPKLQVNYIDNAHIRWLILCCLALAIFYLTALFRNLILAGFGGSFYVAVRVISLGLFLAIIFGKRSEDSCSLHTQSSFKFSHLDCGDPLLFVRFMACFFVLMQHGMGVAFEPNNIKEIIWDDGSWLLFPSAWMGVWIFFVLSGYLMGKGFFSGRYSFNQRGVIDFYVNRLIRIVPIYYLAVLAVSVFLMPQIFNADNIGDLISILLFDNSATLKYVPIGALWSIAVEMQFYLGAPILAGILFFSLKDSSDKKCFLVLLGIFIIGLVYRLITYVDNGALWFSYVFTSAVGNLDLFSSGILVSLILQKFPNRKFQMSISTIGMLMLYVGGAFFVSAVTTAKVGLLNFSFIGPTITGLVTCLIIYIYENAVRNQNISDKLSAILIGKTQYLGILTYPIYVLHEPIYLAMKRNLVGTSPSMLWAIILTATGIFFAFILAAIVHFTIEKPLLRFRLNN